jgi:hypothetical protein
VKVTTQKQVSEDPWTKEERVFFNSLKAPYDIQSFLDSIAYSADPIYRCPRSVIRDRKAHCVDGALLAAAALRRMGHEPLIMELKAVRDDDHILAIFYQDGRVGAIAKSNFSTLRYREPVYRSIRELVMSYFEGYFNVDYEKTLRSYSKLVCLQAFDQLNWLTDDSAVDAIVDRIDAAHHYPICTEKMISRLQLVDERSYQAAMQGANPDGLYRPDKY